MLGLGVGVSVQGVSDVGVTDVEFPRTCLFEDAAPPPPPPEKIRRSTPAYISPDIPHTNILLLSDI